MESKKDACPPELKFRLHVEHVDRPCAELTPPPKALVVIQ